jgi:UDP-N-acetylmuramoylalanine--D-glutamate ligase
MRWRDLDGRRVLVWGMGREGVAAVDQLGVRCHPASVVTVDDGTRETSGERPAVDLAGVDVIVKSPGVSRYRPEIVSFLDRGGLVTSLTDLVLSEREGRRTIGVTGTKGKSTTASLTAALIASAGASVELAGNIGRPASEVMDLGDQWLVLECSSYQSADVTVSPEIGILTSIHEEHLDWHGSFERYVADKLNLFRTSEVTFVSAGEPEAVAATEGWARRALVGGELVPLDGLALAGEHNRRNANLAVHAAARALGDVPVAAFRHALATFQPLEHRLHPIGRYGSLDVVDDVLATAPAAVLNALDVFAGRTVLLLVGGYDRALDYHGFGAALAARPNVRVIAMGPAGRRIADAVESAGGAVIACVDGLPAALDRVDPTVDGVLLLSPGATSYAEFADYRERGAAFRDLLVARGMTT